MTEFKINNTEDRLKMISIFANAGYTVRIKEKENKEHYLRSDFYVQIIHDSELEKPTIINCTISGNCDVKEFVDALRNLKVTHSNLSI